MEEDGKQSSAILVRGVQTGRVNVSARLVDLTSSAGESLDSSVVISVLEPLTLFPAHDVYLAPQMTMEFLLQTWKRQEVLTLPMPNEKYRWKSSDVSVATVSETGKVPPSIPN